ncbi:peroxidase 43 [Andrographis paniculata]|uniref:peroxidase 43 n=1 Tax=Andrographis paniculata TaxID=175694 RepID=UPI0021E7FBEE|nr:peroxidase 43 [Andrographis paniculata]
MSSITVLLVFAFLLLRGFDVCLSQGQLKVGFYSQTCPNAESIVKSVVAKATADDSSTPSVLLRLQFHDCFVQGCDGSILVDNERAAVEHNGVGGFDQIKTAKELIEAQCPGVVSCADIVAMAARDAVALAGGPAFEVETGRRDGKIAMASLAAAIPDVKDSIGTLKSKFKGSGLSEKELVVLTGGGHTIGTTACFFVVDRLYNFTGRNISDPSINPKFLPVLRRTCPKNGDASVRLQLDPITGNSFDDQVFKNIKKGFSVLASDARLLDDVSTKKAVDFYRGEDDGSFARDFAAAMVKMGRIGVKNSSQGEIRRACNAVNK